VITTAALKLALLFVVIVNSFCYALEYWQLHNKTNNYKEILNFRYNFDIFTRFFPQENPLLLTFSYMLYYAVSLVNRQSTFRDTLLISYSSVDIVKNISLQEYVLESMSRNVDNKLPGITASHLSSWDTE
jgi:hypothetical protein